MKQTNSRAVSRTASRTSLPGMIIDRLHLPYPGHEGRTPHLVASLAIVCSVLTLPGCSSGGQHIATNAARVPTTQAAAPAGSATPAAGLVHAGSPEAPLDIRSDQGGGDVPAGAAISGRMGTCLFEAEQLSKLGTPAQKNLVTGLYRNIRAAQQYGPMAVRLAEGTSDMITPLYQFAINDSCNSVSQALLSVLKKQVPVTGGGRD